MADQGVALQDEIAHGHVNWMVGLKAMVVVANPQRVRCNICLQQFQAGDRVVALDCGPLSHVGGDECPEVVVWLLNNPSCPICRDGAAVIAHMRLAHNHY